METDMLRNKIREFIGIQDCGLFPGFKVIKEEECTGYTRQLIHFQGSENDIIPAYLLIPEGKGPFPAILIHHQHNGERHLGKSEVCGLAGNPLQAFGPVLATKGFVVLAPDSICFEDRRRHASGIVPDEENDFLRHLNEMSYRILKGSSLMKKVLEDANIGFSLLKSLECVDKARIGTMGHSYGGNTVLFQTALNEGIVFACSSGAACTYKTKMEHGTGIEMAQVIPGFYNQYDISDIIECIAPRPILLVSADKDKYSQDADLIENSVRKAFIDLDASEKLEHQRYEGGHAITQERFEYIISWLVQAANKE